MHNVYSFEKYKGHVYESFENSPQVKYLLSNHLSLETLSVYSTSTCDDLHSLMPKYETSPTSPQEIWKVSRLIVYCELRIWLCVELIAARFLYSMYWLLSYSYHASVLGLGLNVVCIIHHSCCYTSRLDAPVFLNVSDLISVVPLVVYYTKYFIITSHFLVYRQNQHLTGMKAAKKEKRKKKKPTSCCWIVFSLWNMCVYIYWLFFLFPSTYSMQASL